LPDDPFAAAQAAPDRADTSAATPAGKPADAAPAAPVPGGGHWFVPPPPLPGSLARGGSRVDMRQVGSEENITVTAARRPTQRDPHAVAVPDDSPQHSLAATPQQGDSGQGACHSSAYQTIGGQPASGMDMISAGGGNCD
jgi:hypothetical protein